MILDSQELEEPGEEEGGVAGVPYGRLDRLLGNKSGVPLSFTERAIYISVAFGVAAVLAGTFYGSAQQNDHLGSAPSSESAPE